MTLHDLILNNINKTDQEITDLANAPILTPKSGTVTFATLASATRGIGPIRAMEFRGALRTLQTGTDPQLSILADTVLAVLDGPGFEPADATVATIAAQLQGLQLISSDEITHIIYDISYIVGDGTITINSVTALRTSIERELAFNAIMERINTVRSTFYNEVINPAIANTASAVPTWQQYLDAIANG